MYMDKTIKECHYICLITKGAHTATCTIVPMAGFPK